MPADHYCVKIYLNGDQSNPNPSVLTVSLAYVGKEYYKTAGGEQEMYAFETKDIPGEVLERAYKVEYYKAVGRNPVGSPLGVDNNFVWGGRAYEIAR